MTVPAWLKGATPALTHLGVAALILALLKLPDFLTPINSISESLKKLTPDHLDAAPVEKEKTSEEH